MTRAERRRRIVPEVVQTSAMDCGPAALKAILEGFGISVSYGRLREACQTEIDGSSIDSLESVAQQLGLDAEQAMVPADRLLVAEAENLPALVVVRLPTGGTHFVVAWSTHGPWVQVMDPATGRRWQTRRSFLRDLYIHTFPVQASAWQEWAASDDFIGPLTQCLVALGMDRQSARAMTGEACLGSGWLPLAALDAATRLVASLVSSGGLNRGREAMHVLRRTLARALAAGSDPAMEVPAGFWSVRPAGEDDEGEAMLHLRGAVLVRFRSHTGEAARRPDQVALPADLRAAVTEPPQRPMRQLLRLLSADGVLPPLAVLAGLAVAAGTVIMEALLYRGLLDLGRFLVLAEQRLAAVLAVTAMLIGLMMLAVSMTATVLRQGRHLETRLRLAFLDKIPRLGDRFFHSRLSSDMAERAHMLPVVRSLPSVAGQLWRCITLLLATTAGIVWLDPACAPIAVLTAATAVVLPLASQRVLIERDLRVRTHAGALTRFFLDGLLGIAPLRCHGAERSLRREHEMLLVEWARSSLDLLRLAVGVEGVTALAGFALAVWLLVNHLGRAGESGMVLLLVYWVLSLPALGQELALAARQIPAQRNVTLRLLEPLGAPDETCGATGAASEHGEPAEADRGVAVSLDGVSVQAGGHTILEDLDLHIPAGAHVAVVGRSGAGKSSLVGLLLGWHRPTCGTVSIDGAPLDGAGLTRLRRSTAWVDPAVRLWNRSLIDNLLFGNDEGAQPMGATLEQARLLPVVERLPDGLQTVLGEGGCLVSGGEGQRVRLGRSLGRPGVRLALLDEPFRGLDRGQRRELLAAARESWAGATLLCVTHDISETAGFDRVLVVEGGRIVEDGDPAELARRPAGAYARLVGADREVRETLWADSRWRRVVVADGVVREGSEKRP